MHPITPAGPKPMFLAWRIGNGRRGSTGDLKGRTNDGSFGAGRAQEGSETVGFIGIRHETRISSLKMLESLRFHGQKWGCFGPPVAGWKEISGGCSQAVSLSRVAFTNWRPFPLDPTELKMGPGHLDCLDPWARINHGSL